MADVRPGTVYLVGAGPGDPELLTVRAARLLSAARVVAHDALVPPAVLALAALSAELIRVGRRSGDGAVREPLHPLVRARAAAGMDVVRLKAGDPMIFGRGGEEVEALAREGIPCEVVPGVTAAVGAAAGARVPLTLRGVASAVTFAYADKMDAGWIVQALGRGTVVLYMVGRVLGATMIHLMRAGCATDLPAVFVSDATRPTQRVIRSTALRLVNDVERAGIAPSAPALVILGEVGRTSAREPGGEPQGPRRD